MGEVFPVIAGIIIGLLVSRIGGVRSRWITATLLTVIAGAAATFLSGESRESWGFVFVDIGLVALAAGIAWGVATVVARRVVSAR